MESNLLVPRCFFFFFFFFVLSARGKTAAKPRPLPLGGQRARCAHQPVRKSAFSRILPEGKTRRNPLRAPAACWMLCRQLTDTAEGTPVGRLFKRTGDSSLDAGQAEGPRLFVYCLGGIPLRVHAASSVRLEDSRREVDLLTKTPGGHLCTFQGARRQTLSYLCQHSSPVLVPRCFGLSCVLLSPHFLQTTSAYTPDLERLAM